jgi:Na+-transporting NADH:ubiquinone oxidoreductase subunit NqrD
MIVYIWKIESHVQIVGQCAPWKIANGVDTFHTIAIVLIFAVSTTLTVTIRDHRFNAVSMVIVKMAYLTLLPLLS